jgi:hypothetical protein
MYNNDVGKGGAQGCEAFEVKQRVALVRVPFYFINLLPTSLLYISILITHTQTHAIKAALRSLSKLPYACCAVISATMTAPLTKKILQTVTTRAGRDPGRPVETEVQGRLGFR